MRRHVTDLPGSTLVVWHPDDSSPVLIGVVTDKDRCGIQTIYDSREWPRLPEWFGAETVEVYDTPPEAASRRGWYVAYRP